MRKYTIQTISGYNNIIIIIVGVMHQWLLVQSSLCVNVSYLMTLHWNSFWLVYLCMWPTLPQF